MPVGGLAVALSLLAGISFSMRRSSPELSVKVQHESGGGQSMKRCPAKGRMSQPTGL